MPTIYIDNQPYTVAEGKNLLEACLSLGFNLPFFCWHPALHSVGACRQCAVKMFKDEADTRGRIIMSCMTPVKEGVRISIDDPEAVAFRAGVIEWLMVNHPHDCPVCDEGGECHLQDMTVMTGHTFRRYRFTKRTYRNQNLGPFVNHEMNRCIQCYRCVRYYREFAGGHDLDVFGWHDHVYFGRHEEGALESPFSGNLVEVCPTGVFTDKTLKQHYTRKWDLQTAPSICVHCGAGCNIIPGERYGRLRRIRNRYNGDVNGYFLCDRGRFGYAFVNSEARITAPLVHGEPAAPDELLLRLASLLQQGRIVGVGSPRASLEANFALRRLVGEERFYPGVSPLHARLVGRALEILRTTPLRTPSQQEIAQSDAVFILGEDVLNTAPMLALALRQAAVQGPKEKVQRDYQIPPFDAFPTRELVGSARSPFFVATPFATWLDTEASIIYRGAPDDLARLGFAVAHAIDAGAPAVMELPAETQEIAGRIAEGLLAGERPVVLSGFNCGSEAVLQAAANVAQALQAKGKTSALSYTVPECNSMGLAMLGGGAIEGALQALRAGEADTLVVLENDLYHTLDADTADALLAAAPHVIVLDHLHNETTRKAEIVLPAATFAEAEGTLVNHEGRAQRFFQVFVPPGEMQASWRWVGELLTAAGMEAIPWQHFDALQAELAAAMPELGAIRAAAPSADFRLLEQRVARQSHRVSGRTAIAANVTVFEPPPPDDPDSPLAFTMEGYHGQPPAPLIPRFWAPGWNSHHALHKYQQEVGGALRGGNPGVRLLEPAVETVAYFADIPSAFSPRTAEWLVLPIYDVFGAEPLSLHAPGVAERAPAPYLAMNAATAAQLACREGDEAAIVVAGRGYRAPVRILDALPTGVMGLTALHGALPAWGTITRGDEEVNR